MLREEREIERIGGEEKVDSYVKLLQEEIKEFLN